MFLNKKDYLKSLAGKSELATRKLNYFNTLANLFRINIYCKSVKKLAVFQKYIEIYFCFRPYNPIVANPPSEVSLYRLGKS